MFREAVLAFLGVKDPQKSGREGIKSKYCAACKKAGKANCDDCDQKIEVIYS